MSGTSQRFRSLVSSPGKPTISPSRHIILPVKVAIQMKPAKASLDPNGWLKDLLKSAILSGAAPPRRGNSTSPNRLPGSIRQCLKGTCRSFCGFTIPGSGESRSALHKHERPVARASQIAEQTVDQKPQRHPRGNVDAQKVMLWLSKDIVHVLFVSTFAYDKPTVQASYGHGSCVLRVVLVSVGNHEDAVDSMFTEPGLHNYLRRADLMHLMIRRRFGATISGWRLVHKPCDSAGKRQSDN